MTIDRFVDNNDDIGISAVIDEQGDDDDNSEYSFDHCGNLLDLSPEEQVARMEQLPQPQNQQLHVPNNNTGVKLPVQVVRGSNTNENSNSINNDDDRNNNVSSSSIISSISSNSNKKKNKNNKDTNECDVVGTSSAGRGLRNDGNSCYINASLQQLFSVPKFIESISVEKEKDGFCSVLSKLWTDLEGRMDTNEDCVAASARPVKVLMDQLTDRFKGSQQHDSHEFLGELIDRIHDELSGSQEREINSKDNINAMPPMNSDNKDKVVAPAPVDEFFRWNVQVTLECESCGYSRCKEESYRYLSIAIGDGIKPSIDSCLRDFFGAEVRDVNCEKCKVGKTVTQTMKILSKPKAALIHLNRFSVVEKQITDSNNCLSKEMVIQKNQVPVELTPNLSFDNYLLADENSIPSEKYRVTSILYHIGNTPNSGHYRTDGLRCSDGNVQWISFDDKYTSTRTFDQVVHSSQNEETAYMLLYHTSRTTTATMADPSLCAPSPPPITSRRRSNSRSLSGISVEDGTTLCSPPVSLDNTENANGDDDDHHHHHHRHHEEGSVSAESNTCSTPSEGGVRYSIVIHTKELGLNIDPTTGIIQDVTNEEYLSAKFISASEIIIHGDKVVQIGNTQLFDGNTVVYVPDIIANNTQRPITIVIERDPTLYRFVDGPFYNRGIDSDDMDHRFNRSDVGMVDNNDDTIILPTTEEEYKLKPPESAIVQPRFPNEGDDMAGCSSNSDDDDDYGGFYLSPDKSPPKPSIRLKLGDKIEFYAVNTVVGNPSNLKQGKIIGIRPGNKYKPLLVSGSILPIPSEHAIRILPDENWYTVNRFILEESGVQNIVEGEMRNIAERFKKGGADIEEAAKNYWENQANERKNSDQDKENETKDDNDERSNTEFDHPASSTITDIGEHRHSQNNTASSTATNNNANTNGTNDDDNSSDDMIVTGNNIDDSSSNITDRIADVCIIESNIPKELQSHCKDTKYWLHLPTAPTGMTTRSSRLRKQGTLSKRDKKETCSNSK